MNERPPIERNISQILVGGVTLSALLLIVGMILFIARDILGLKDGIDRVFLFAGIFLLMGTPIFRILTTTVLFVQQRDWLFTSYSLWVLLTLTVSIVITLLL